MILGTSLSLPSKVSQPPSLLKYNIQNVILKSAGQGCSSAHIVCKWHRRCSCTSKHTHAWGEIVIPTHQEYQGYHPFCTQVCCSCSSRNHHYSLMGKGGYQIYSEHFTASTWFFLTKYVSMGIAVSLCFYMIY